ncbi:melibiose:sodium transporter MelB [Vibrio sp. 10N.261.46.E12]|uniref:melibiose:sodium transporter MelB n=1 Tax=unclassified Vibrio TaxID=2614977 RepID=UPI0009779333|nr:MULTISPECIES: melibiose:sodium transporter MelB [unclassified Vibrio]OMO32724.1 melibiose:sodium transporter MelB [Vibrio sp. 10N.261.45.E1]PMJ27152.1 melibiose:sodium transporter MelB [Vibrio sp. 10N.286.45.B6]PML87847.1 melibiose:sodium transporter MelB [Vibrio sp. 10N.261.49.E11]PMM73085.1 melibiose:sodium transporter MelB [Vibrio sp. 10N.261.46.F12]PMM82136.1 melibiose:sodium transporter MelB [Vibrio sp. 10N.261.46.E8]
MSDQITLQTKLSYGLGALGKDFACAPIYIFLMFYFTDVAGLSAAFVGTIFLAARIVDAVTDPMMGVIVDNTRSKFGKFRPWIVIGTLLNAVVLVGLFSTHMFEGTTLYIYAAAAYILWGLTYTIMDIPYWSMIPALSSSRQEREKLVVWPRLFASLAWFITGTYGLHIVGKLGDGDQGQGFFNVAMLIAVLYVMSAFLIARNVKEKSAPANAKPAERFSFKDVMVIIGKNDQLKALIGTVLSFQIANLLVGGFAIYYFSYALGNADLFPVYMMVAGIAEVAGVFLFPRIASVLPRKHLWVMACGFPVLSCITLLIMGFIAPGNAILIGIAGAAIKFGVGIANALQTVMLADVVDYGEHKTGRRSESVIFSVQTMLVKFAGAAGGFIVGIGLSIVGYVPNVEQSDSTIMGLQFMMVGLPAILMTVSALVYKRYYHLHEGFDKEQADEETKVNVVTAEA